MKLKEAMEINGKEVICLVGGGGKTTLMFALAKELTDSGRCVITTTTTRIFEPTPLQTERLILNRDEDLLLKQLSGEIEKYRHVTIAREKLVTGKLSGITRNMAMKVSEISRVSHVIIEADGAAHNSLKAPNETEPVVPSNTTLVIAMAGIDALGRKLDEENVFRADIAAKLLHIPLGTVISAKMMAELIIHPKGILKESPGLARIVPFINKTDIDNGREKARQVAHEILAINNPRIKKVLLGQVQCPNPVIEIIGRKEI